MKKNIQDMMIRKPSLKYRDVRNYEGEYYDWPSGEHLLKKGTVVNEVFHPLDHDIRFVKDEQVPLRDGVKILTDVYLPADTVRYCLHDMEGGNLVDQPATQFPPVGTEYKKLFLNGTTRQMSEAPQHEHTPVFYLCQSAAPKASFYLTVDKRTDFIGYPKAHLFVEADGSDDMDLFLIVQKLDRHYNVLRQFTIPSTSPTPHDMLENYGGVAKYSGAYGRLRVSRRHLDEKQSTDIIPVLSFDREEKLKKSEIVEIEVPLAPTGMTLYPGETLRFMVSSKNITGNVHPGVPAYESKDNLGRHIIHCGGEYQSYLQIGVLG